ncbi:hypothetical protein [Tuwongella immobilis]|uniref:Uncharacterized protein n=1 Tax=Tuwongella immobilis TaxID=692036 RepID=A0A6C2YV27_9BACT|nr:hypothetical protein [Tuwongella immobilis]VIP04839.1 Uncharacterized protein OS=Maricaulis maris (strain MCS10) GN=Mmar10_1099 PE=4 SV=1 [Tuwongella immobilis]VTS07038.1 Uncharacterized protein OS=Maricaulis maris (strain MCS10) GN=Mmar10_1099 PE=4 SV=1 [Tuwongella immobilis]
MRQLLIRVGVILAGCIAGVVVIALVEMAGMALFPLPEGLKLDSNEAIAEAMPLIPLGGKIMVVVAWGLGSLVGGWLAARISPRRAVTHALIVGGLLLAMGIAQLASLPHPQWMVFFGAGCFLPMAAIGGVLGSPRRAVALESTQIHVG